MEDIQLVTCPWCPRAEEPLSSHFIFLQQNVGHSVKEAPAKQRHQRTTQETKRQVCPFEIICKGTGKSSEISSSFQAVSFPADLTSIMTLVFPPLQDFWASVSNKSSNQSTFQFQLQSGSLNEASRYWAIPSKQAEGNSRSANHSHVSRQELPSLCTTNTGLGYRRSWSSPLLIFMVHLIAKVGFNFQTLAPNLVTFNNMLWSSLL